MTHTNSLIKKTLFGLFMTLTATFSQANNDNPVIQSANDQRHYDYTELDNGLKLLVISDINAQRAGVAVDVNVGSSAEPDEFPGLAHFLEHMLFLGTDQYPNPDDYLNYISDHGGNHNAFTAFDHTNYFFDIDPDYLHDGLKRFSRFFIASLMSAQYVERERNAVDSEFQSKLRDDPWRNMSVLKQAINPEHPYSRFSIGNNTTLPNDSVRTALLKFYQTYYSADRMAVVIIGKENTDTLMTWGKTLFSAVEKRPATDLSINTKLFDEKQLPLMIKNPSIKNEKNLSLYFQLPYKRSSDYDKSLAYLSYILGYEGKGSLLQALKQADYANELYAGSGYRIGQEVSFEIGFELTDKGYQQINNVVAMIFAYLDLLNQDPLGKARYQEIATVAKTAFRFKDKVPAIHEVSMLASRLNHYPVSDIQALTAIYQGYNYQQINRYLAKMRADNVVLQLTAPDISGTQTTPYFNVPYEITTIATDTLTHLADSDRTLVKAMGLPALNPFVADDYTLQNYEPVSQNMTLDSGIDLYYKNDTTFGVPRASVDIALQPAMTLSLHDKVALSLLARLIDEQLTTTLYDASLAGLMAEIGAGEKSLTITLNGYQQKMPVLLQQILQQLSTLSIDETTFKRIKNNYHQELDNAKTKMPYQQTFSHLNHVLVADATLPETRLTALASITPEILQDFVTKALAKMAVRMMVYGNYTQPKATQLAELIPDVLATTDFHHEWQSNQATIVDQTIADAFAVAHDDHAITYYIQAGKGYHQRAVIGILAKLIEPQFFTQLRTEQQLGYIVFAYPKPTFDQAGIGFTIQSPVADDQTLKTAIESFIAGFIPSLTEINERDFATVKTILQSELLQQPENLTSAASRYWADILTTGDTASSRQAIADAIDKIELTSFINNAQQILQHGSRVVVTATPQTTP